MTSLCLDTSVITKLLVLEPGSAAASALVTPKVQLLEPAFVWAEVGSVLRKKERQGFPAVLATQAWDLFLRLAIQRIDNDAIASASWKLAQELSQLTLYDTAFLAVAEEAACPLWTADQQFFTPAHATHPSIQLLPTET